MKNLTKKPEFIYLALIIILGGAVYLNVIPNGFVWDDISQVVENLFIRDWHNLPLLFGSGTFYSGEAKPSGAFYRPLVSAFYLISYYLFGLKSFGFHLFQIFFHLATAVLLFFVLNRILSSGGIKHAKEISFLSSVIFVIHPANVESVAFVGSIGEILYAFFGLLSLLFLIFGLDAENKIIKNKPLFLSFIFAPFSLLSKETGIVVLAVSFFTFCSFSDQDQISI